MSVSWPPKQKWPRRVYLNFLMPLGKFGAVARVRKRCRFFDEHGGALWHTAGSDLSEVAGLRCGPEHCLVSGAIVLSKAAASEDGAAVVPPKLNEAAAAKIGSSLIGRKLMRESRSKPGMPAWRKDEDGRSMSLVITRAGRDAIGIERAVETDRPVSNKSSAAKRADRYLASAALRAGSKQSLVVEMLSKHQGTTQRIRNETTGSSLYRIANGPNAAAGA
jgi:hypothetical protein